MISTILFDYGDTLIYRNKPIEEIREKRLEFLHKYLINKKINIDIKILKENFYNIWDPIYKKCEEESIEIPAEETIPKILEKIGIKHKYDKEIEHVFFKPDLESIMLFPEVKEVLNFLKNNKYKIGLISNTVSDWFVKETLKKLKIEKFFDCIITSAQIRIRKPRLEIFEKALKELNANKSQTVMIGDSLKSDILGAKRLGIKAIYVNRWKNNKNIDINPDATIHNLLEIIPIISKW
ncbi:MAG: HAD family hydrolase [Nitrososphaerota archaeon]